MNTNRVAVDFITVLVMACCLALGGFASAAWAEPLVVTTLADTADPPFNADGPCGTGTGQRSAWCRWPHLAPRGDHCRQQYAWRAHHHL